MTKQQLWQTVYIEAMKQGRMSKPKELADQAVKEFEERFEESTNPMDKSIKSSDLFIMHEKFEKKEHIIKWVYDPECGCDRCDKID